MAERLTPHRIEIGATVKLNSGGPDMLVILMHNNVCLCQWVTHTKIAMGVHQCLFHMAELTEVKTDAD